MPLHCRVGSNVDYFVYTNIGTLYGCVKCRAKERAHVCVRKTGEVKMHCYLCTSKFEERFFVVCRYVGVGRCSLVMAMGIIQRGIPLLTLREVLFHRVPLGNAGGK